MATSINQSAPIALVTAVAAYCCWPYVGGLGPSSGHGTGTKPEITPALLTPAVEPVAERDPFHLPKKAPAPVAAVQKPDKPPAAPVTVSASDLTSGLVLNATYVRGGHRLAFINGQAYAEGESLTGPNFKTPCVVGKVYPHKILLEHLGQQAELTYSNTDAKAGSSPQAGPHGTPAKPEKTRTRIVADDRARDGPPAEKSVDSEELTTDPNPGQADDQHTTVDH